MFVKLFALILDSSIWISTVHTTRLLWITMLCMADETGVVRSSVPGLANRARITLEECEAGLVTLSSPDQHSRSEEHAGRRIEKVDGGWLLLNYAKYREIRTRKQISAAHRKRRQRDKSRTSRSVTTNASTSILPVLDNPVVGKGPHARARGDADFDRAWSLYPKRSGSNSRVNARRAWDARVKDGVTVTEIISGTERYAAFVAAGGVDDPRFVMQASTFFGPGEHWTEAWELPLANGRGGKVGGLTAHERRIVDALGDTENGGR